MYSKYTGTNFIWTYPLWEVVTMEGAIIKFIPGTNNLTVAKSFENNARFPGYSNLIQASNGKLYDMTGDGGNSDGMVLFFPLILPLPLIQS